MTDDDDSLIRLILIGPNEQETKTLETFLKTFQINSSSAQLCTA
jgi:hypothetical protein